MPQVIAAAASVISYVTAASAAAAAGTATLAQTLTVIGANVALAAGANMAAGLLQPNVSSSGQAITWTADPNAPLHFAAGRIGVAGQIVYRNAYGPNDRMYQSLISVVSAAGPIDGWESFKADDTTVTFDSNGKANSTHYANVMWRQTRLGTQPDTALTSPTGLEGGATLPGWGSSYKLSGKASFILTLAENSKRSAYSGREPQPLNVFRGLKVYDPRLDSTYPGGSGSHRLNNPATWTYSNNPILWGLKWSLGLWEDTTGKGAPQVGQQVGGIGAPIDSIDVASFVEAANIADANDWTTAAWPSTDDDKAQVLDAFLQAGGAYYIERTGKIACLHRAAPRASVATISAQDTAGPLEIDTTASRIQRKNAIVPSIWSEADGWQITAIEEVTNATWVSEDGDRKRSEGVTFPYVTDATQAAQLACLQIAHTREGISGRIPLKPYMQGIEPGDCFTITEPGFVLHGQKFLCLETSYDAATGVHTVTFVSESDGKYPFALGQTQTPPSPPVLTPVDPTVVQGPGSGDWVVTVPGPAPDGTQFPTIDLTGYVSNENADAMLIAWRAVQEGEDPEVVPDFTDENGAILPGWTDAGTFPPTTTQLNLTGMQPGSIVWLAIRYKRGSNVSLAQRVGPITVGTLIAQPSDATPDTDPPAAPTSLTAEGGLRSIYLEWDNPSDTDLAQVQIFRNTTNNSGTATQIGTAAASPSVGGFFVDADPDLPIGSTRYYWIKAVDRWGNVSVNFSNVANAAARGTNVTDFASTVRPIELFASDAAAGSPTLGRVYFNTTTYRLRRGTGSAWTDAIPSTTITGQLTDGQIADIAAAKLTGQITATQVSDGAISTPKLAAGSVSTAKLAAGAVVADTIAAGAITTAKLEAGAVTTAKLAAGAVTANEILADTITGGQIAAGAISTTELAAGAVTTNILGALQVTAEKIAAGAITTDKLAANSVTANEIDVNNLAAIAADLGDITAGNINMVAGTRRLRINPGFGPSGNMVLWVGPTSVPTGSETVDNGLLGISTDDAFFGGRVVSGPFDSGAPSSSLLTISGWTTVATVAIVRCS